MRLGIVTTIAVAGVIVSYSGCSTSSDDETSGSAREFAQTFRGYQADYDEVQSADILAERAFAVVAAVPVSVSEGRSYNINADNSDPYVTAVVEYQVTELLSGELTKEASDRVFIEMSVTGGFASSDIAQTLPVGKSALLYLSPASTKVSDPILIDETAGRPTGYPLFVVGPQDLYIEEDGMVFSILEGEVFQDATLEDFRPGTGELPEGQPLDR